MSDDPLLDTPIEPKHQALSARLTLVAVYVACGRCSRRGSCSLDE